MSTKDLTPEDISELGNAFTQMVIIRRKAQEAYASGELGYLKLFDQRDIALKAFEDLLLSKGIEDDHPIIAEFWAWASITEPKS